MTRDAKKQSVGCDSHNWTGTATGQITCQRCQALPTVKQIEEAEAVVRLKEWLSAGDTVFTNIRNVSRSGMSRVIQAYKFTNNERGVEPLHLGWNIAKVTGWKYDREREGVKVDGCGMDMGFHLVYTLSRILFPDGYGCIGKGCPSNDHSNGDRDYMPHGKPTSYTCGTCDYIGPCSTCPKCVTQNKVVGEVGHWHNDGGYALQQRWL